MLTIKQSIRAVSVLLLVMVTVFICTLFAIYNDNLSLAQAAAKLIPDNTEMLTQLEGKVSMGNMIFVISMISMGLTSIVTLVMYISRHIAENHASMGILKAMGYRSGQIAHSYIVLVVPVFLGAIPGFIAAILFEPGFEVLLNGNIVIPDFTRKFPAGILILSVLVPVFLFSAISVLAAAIKLRRPPLTMIRGNIPLKTGVLARRYANRKKKRPFLKELSGSVVRGNLMLVFFVVFAGLAFGNQMQLGFSVAQMTDKALAQTLESVGYESNVRMIQYEDMEQTESQLPYVAVYGDISFGEESLAHGELVVFQSGSKLLKLRDADSKAEIDLNALDGVVVNAWMRDKYSLALGDTVTLVQNGTVFSLPVAAVERSTFGETIYCGFGTAQRLGLATENGYNGYYSSEAVSFEPEQHIFVTTVEDMRAEFETQKETYRTLSVLFFVLGTLIGFITLQIALRSIVNANRKYSAMMKAYGYSGAERSRAILGKYRPVAYIGFLIGSVYAYGILAIMFGMTAKTSAMLVPVTVDIWAVVISPILFIAAYEAIIMLYTRKIEKISLKELMAE